MLHDLCGEDQTSADVAKLCSMQREAVSSCTRRHVNGPLPRWLMQGRRKSDGGGSQSIYNASNQDPNAAKARGERMRGGPNFPASLSPEATARQMLH